MVFVSLLHLVLLNLFQEAQWLADKWKIPYTECSAKTGECITEMFHALLKEIEKGDGLLAEAESGECTVL
jgi:putative protein kinase ArgK-like GTPase of G3E family